MPLTYAIQTWPAHGTLDTSDLPQVTYYALTNCYEGQDSFTFTASDGQHTSAPATVTLFISSGVYANPVSVPPACLGTPVGITLDGGASCGQVSYALLSSPSHGTVDTNSMPYTYTPTDTNFTGTDSFNYRVTDVCGYSVTNTVTITNGDAGITPNSQTLMTGTNQPLNITLTANSPLGCANAFNYSIVSGPAHGTLSGTGANRVYTPNSEGLDSFRFTANDGVWAPISSSTVTIYVLAGPILTTDCDPFRTGPFVELDWSLDNAVQQMQQQGLYIADYKIYRSSVSGSNYTCIYTNPAGQMSYSDTNVVAGQTNYYVVTFEFTANGTTYESPFSDEVVASVQNPNDLIAPDATWDVWDVTANGPPVWKQQFADAVFQRLSQPILGKSEFASVAEHLLAAEHDLVQ